MTTPGSDNTVRATGFVDYAESVLDGLVMRAKGPLSSGDGTAVFYTLIGDDCAKCTARVQRKDDSWLVTLEVGSKHMWCLMNRLWNRLATHGWQILPQDSGAKLEYVVA